MWKRIIADTILFLSIFFAPWWVTVGLGVLFVFLFPRFWETVLAGLFLDALYYTETSGIYGRFGVFTISALILIVVAEKIKKQIRI